MSRSHRDGDLAWLGLLICVMSGVCVGLLIVLLVQTVAHGTVVGASGDLSRLQQRIPRLQTHTYAHLTQRPDVAARYLTLEPDDSWTWASVADGGHDADLRAWGAAIAHAGPRLVTFSHEPMTGQHAMYGDPAAFRAAWRHVHDVFAAEGARVRWLWVVTWASMGDDPASRSYPARWWPGRDYADAVAAEDFNWSGCHGGWTSFASKADDVQEWGRRYGKPVAFAEVGSNRERAQWLRGAARWVHRHDVMALFYFNTPHPEHGCEWRLTGDREIDALRGMLR